MQVETAIHRGNEYIDVGFSDWDRKWGNGCFLYGEFDDITLTISEHGELILSFTNAEGKFIEEVIRR